MQKKPLAIVAVILLGAAATPASAAGPALALLAPWWLGRHVIGTVARLAALPLLAASINQQPPEYPPQDRYGYEEGPRGYYSPPPYYYAPRPAYSPGYGGAPAYYPRPYYALPPAVYYPTGTGPRVPRVAGYYPAPQTYYRAAPYYVRPQPRVYEPPSRIYYSQYGQYGQYGQHGPYPTSYSAHASYQTRGTGYRRR